MLFIFEMQRLRSLPPVTCCVHFSIRRRTAASAAPKYVAHHSHHVDAHVVARVRGRLCLPSGHLRGGGGSLLAVLHGPRVSRENSYLQNIQVEVPRRRTRQRRIRKAQVVLWHHPRSHRHGRTQPVLRNNPAKAVGQRRARHALRQEDYGTARTTSARQALRSSEQSVLERGWECRADQLGHTSHTTVHSHRRRVQGRVSCALPCRQHRRQHGQERRQRSPRRRHERRLRHLRRAEKRHPEQQQLEGPNPVEEHGDARPVGTRRV